MTIDKQKLQKLLWSEVASWKADCSEWKQSSEALGEFLGEKTVEEVALELLAENECLRKECAPADGGQPCAAGKSGGRAMTDYTELQKAAEYAAQDTIKFADESEEMRALQQFHEEVDPETVLALIAENQRLTKENSEIESVAITYIEDMQEAQHQNERLTELFNVGMTLDGNLRVYGDWQSVRKAQEILAERDQLKAENDALRKVISDSATSCGAAVSVECSLDFMGHLPVEIFSVISKLRNALAECADSLHGEMLQKFGGQLSEDMHPVTRREYDRDMAEVARYRAAMGKGEQS